MNEPHRVGAISVAHRTPYIIRPINRTRTRVALPPLKPPFTYHVHTHSKHGRLQEPGHAERRPSGAVRQPERDDAAPAVRSDRARSRSVVPADALRRPEGTRLQGAAGGARQAGVVAAAGLHVAGRALHAHGDSAHRHRSGLLADAAAARRPVSGADHGLLLSDRRRSVHDGQDRVRQCAERSVRDGRDRLRQHADAAGGQHEDDGEGARRGDSVGDARL